MEIPQMLLLKDQIRCEKIESEREWGQRLKKNDHESRAVAGPMATAQRPRAVHVYKKVCSVMSSWAETGRDECPSRNTTSIPLPSKAQKILGRGNRKSVSAGNQGEELWNLQGMTALQHDPTAVAADCAGPAQDETVNSQSRVILEGPLALPLQDSRCFQLCTQWGAHQAPTDSSKCVVTQKALIKITGS